MNENSATDVIERLRWQIAVMREIPSNRISDRVTVNAKDIEELIREVTA